MAYPASSALKEVFAANHRQTITVVVSPVTGDQFTITQQRVKSGTKINRSCATGSSLALGSVIASELVMMLDNSTGWFDNKNLLGAEYVVQYGCADWDDPEASVHSLPMGIFEGDSVQKSSSNIVLSALDRMVLFDKPYVAGSIVYPITVDAMVTQICTLCNVTLLTNVANLPNGNYTVTAEPVADKLTYRQLLAWCCEITGTCAYMDWNGKLNLAWYDTVSGEETTTADRFSSTLAEEDVTITGIQIVTEDETTYLAGTEGYVISIEGNLLIQHDEAAILSNLSSGIVNFSYTPYSAATVPKPYLYPLDIISFVDAAGNAHNAPITDITVTLNGNTQMKGRGESSIEKGYASSNPLTNAQKIIIQQLQKEQNATLNKRVQDVLAFNELISNSLGLYSTSVTQEDGSAKMYLHNLPSLEESMTIFTATANGVAWTTSGWNNGSPVWSYGVTSAGDALFRLLSAEGINVSKEGSDFHIEITPSTFSVYYLDMPVAVINASDEGDVIMEIPKIKTSSYVQCGRIRMSPHGTAGIDFVFME